MSAIKYLWLRVTNEQIHELNIVGLSQIFVCFIDLAVRQHSTSSANIIGGIYGISYTYCIDWFCAFFLSTVWQPYYSVHFDFSVNSARPPDKRLLTLKSIKCPQCRIVSEGHSHSEQRVLTASQIVMAEMSVDLSAALAEAVVGRVWHGHAARLVHDVAGGGGSSGGSGRSSCCVFPAAA